MQNALKIALPALTCKLATDAFVACVASFLAMVMFCYATHSAERPIKAPDSTSRHLVDTQDTTTAFVFNAARAHSVGLKRATAADAVATSDGGASSDIHVADNPDLVK